jgi:hypothetical protein
LEGGFGDCFRGKGRREGKGECDVVYLDKEYRVGRVGFHQSSKEAKNF